MNGTYIALIVAMISAATALYGYTNERRKERELELAKIRHQIYEDFVANFFASRDIFSEVLADPSCPKGNILEIYAFGFANHPRFAEHMQKTLKTNTLLCIYGADEAVKAAAMTMRHAAEFAQGLNENPPDIGALILELRKYLFAPQSSIRKTQVTSAEINQLMTP